MKAAQLRKHATSVVLVLSALGLGAYVWLDRDRPTTDEVEGRKDNLLPVLRRDDVSTIVLERDGKSASIVRRDEGDAGDFMYYLEVEGDKNTYADQVAVEQLLQALEFATRIRKVDDGFDLKATGLEPPAMQLTVHMGSAVYRIDIGADAQTPPGARYARLEGQGVFVVPRGPAESMARPIESYRTRRIVPYTSSELASIEIDGPEGKVLLTRGPWDGFRVQNVGPAPRVSRLVFERMLGAFANANAERFVSAEAAKQAVDGAKTSVRVTLVPKDGERAELLIGGDCPQTDGSRPGADKLVVIIRRSQSPLHACTPSTVLGDLQVPASAFADRRVIAATPDEVEELEIVRGTATLELARKGGGWHARKPEDRELQARDVDGFLASLLALEGELATSPDPSKMGLNPPVGTITIRQPSVGDMELPPQIVDIGAEVEGEHGATIALRRRQDDVVLLVPRSAAHLLEPSTTLIRSTELLAVNPLHLKRVEIRHADGPDQMVERAGAGFDLVAPKGFDADIALAADLFDALARLQAERWVADAEDGTFGTGTPSIRVRLQFDEKGKVEQRELILGSPTPDGRYGRWEPDTGVFVVPRSLDEMLRSYVIDRSRFMVDRAIADGLTIRSRGRELRIAATGETWTTASGSQVDLPERSIQRIQQALGEMRAEGVVHLGPAKPEEGFDDPILRISVRKRPEVGGGPVVIEIGRRDVWRNMNVYFARLGGNDATYAIAQAKVRPILELIGPLPP